MDKQLFRKFFYERQNQYSMNPFIYSFLSKEGLIYWLVLLLVYLFIGVGVWTGLIFVATFWYLFIKQDIHLKKYEIGETYIFKLLKKMGFIKD